MGGGRIAKELERLRQTGDADAYVRRTAADYDRIARQIVRHVDTPPYCDADDVRQELLLALFEHRLLETWEPDRQPLGKYVVWQSWSRAKRWLHKQRGASRYDARAPSTYALAFSSLQPEGEDREQGEVVRGGDCGVDATQEESVDSHRIGDGIRDFLAGGPSRHAFDVLRECGGDVDAAAARIWGTPVDRAACEVSRPAQAGVLVQRVLDQVTEIIATAMTGKE